MKNTPTQQISVSYFDFFKADEMTGFEPVTTTSYKEEYVFFPS